MNRGSLPSRQSMRPCEPSMLSTTYGLWCRCHGWVSPGSSVTSHTLTTGSSWSTRLPTSARTIFSPDGESTTSPRKAHLLQIAVLDVLPRRGGPGFDVSDVRVRPQQHHGV